MRITYAKEAAKTLLRMPGHVADSVERKLAMIAEAPSRTDLDIRPLVNRPGLRLRVGDWRVIFRICDDTVEVLRIAPRGKAYK